MTEFWLPGSLCNLSLHLWHAMVHAWNGCSQRSRFPTAGQGERSSGNEIMIGTEKPWVLEWIRIPSDACERANSIWIRYVFTKKFLNSERKSCGFKNIRIRVDGASDRVGETTSNFWCWWIDFELSMLVNRHDVSETTDIHTTSPTVTCFSYEVSLLQSAP